MKRTIPVITIFIVLIFISACTKPKKYNLDIQRVESDTVFVEQNGSEECRFNVNADPGIYASNITAQVYKGSETVGTEKITSSMVSYQGLQTSVGATVVVSAMEDCPVGEYRLEIFMTNGKLTNSISYVLIVR